MISPILIAMIILICVFWTGFLTVLESRFTWFYITRYLFGSDGVVKIPFDNYSFAEQVCSIALIFIMFYGGFGTNVRYAKNVAVRAVLLSTVGVLVTFAVTGCFLSFCSPYEFRLNHF